MIKEAIPLRDCVAGVPAIELVRAALEDVLPSPAASQAQAGHYAGYCSPSTFDDTPADPIAHGAGKLRVGGSIVVAPFAACGAFVQRLARQGRKAAGQAWLCSR